LKNRCREQLGAAKIPVGIALILIAATSGCVHTGQRYGFAVGVETSLPEATAIVTGPVAAGLAHGDAFTSEFTMTLQDASGPPLTGQLFAREGKLRLEVVFPQNRKTGRLGNFGVIWDQTVRQGYIISDALQGYAPISEMTWVTNLVTEAVAAPAERVEGHPVDHANVTFKDSGGQTTVIQLLRAQDMDNLPLQIHSLSGPQSFTLTLAKIQRVIPAIDLFSLPDGLTRYDSETALLGELAARQENVFGGGNQHEGEYLNPADVGNRYRSGQSPAPPP
jgi:hypothetical protein